MSYRKIPNLYRSKDILLFKQCYATEKIHGTSAHIKFKEDKLHFFSGGAKHDQFLTLFNQDELLAKFRANAEEHPEVKEITIFGEAFGGKMQGMKETYGPDLKFIAFEVYIHDQWCSVPQAEKIALKFGFEFVPYEIIETTEEAINAAMMSDSVVAVRNGMGTGKMREGVVLRPIAELIYPNGGRVICKHKRPEFAEREHTPRFADPEQLKVLESAKEIADEWTTKMRLDHVLDKLQANTNPHDPDNEPRMEDMNKIIKAMVEDILIEAKGEIVESKELRKQIGTKTVKLFKEHLMKSC